jgi:hypothetical protein
MPARFEVFCFGGIYFILFYFILRHSSHSVAQAGLELSSPLASALLGLQLYTTMPSLDLTFYMSTSKDSEQFSGS